LQLIYSNIFSIGKFSFQDIAKDVFVGRILFVFYQIFVFFIIVNFFVALITESYSKVKDLLQAAEDEAREKGTLADLDMFHFIHERIMKFLGRDKERQRLLAEENLRFGYITGQYFISLFLTILLVSHF